MGGFAGMCRIVCPEILSIDLTDNLMWGNVEIAGWKKSGPQGVSTQSMNLRLEEEIESRLAFMINSWRTGEETNRNDSQRRIACSTRAPSVW